MTTRRAVLVPAAANETVAVIEVADDWRALAAAIGGPCQYIERVQCALTPAPSPDANVHLVMVCDEEGQYNGQPVNRRGWPLYPVEGYVLRGNVLVMAEGYVADGLDFVDLPDADWALNLVRATVR